MMGKPMLCDLPAMPGLRTLVFEARSTLALDFGFDFERFNHTRLKPTR